MDRARVEKEEEDKNEKTKDMNVSDNGKSCASPVFKRVVPGTSKRFTFGSSDYDAPSYSVNRPAKSDNSCGKNINTSPDMSKACSTSRGRFEHSKINDGHISRSNSMNSPAPQQVPESKFNTAGKATFCPKEQSQNIEQKAIFPHNLLNDFKCHSVSLCLENENEASDSADRLSGDCATLNQLEVSSLDQVAKQSAKKNSQEKSVISSLTPEKGKSKGGNDKISNGDEPNCHGSDLGEDVLLEKTGLCCLDELCSLALQKGWDKPAESRSVECNKAPASIGGVSSGTGTVKKFYPEGVHSYIIGVPWNKYLNSSRINALALQDEPVLWDYSNEEVFFLTERERFGGSRKGLVEVGGAAEVPPGLKGVEGVEGAGDCNSSIVRNSEGESIGWQRMKGSFLESELDVSDEDLCRTVEDVERALAEQESERLRKLSGTGVSGASTSGEERGRWQCRSKDESEGPSRVSRGAHRAGSGSLEGAGASRVGLGRGFGGAGQGGEESEGVGSSVVERSLIDLSRGVLGREQSVGGKFCGFTTSSGRQVTVTTKALERAKAFVKKCEDFSVDGSTSRSFSNGLGEMERSREGVLGRCGATEELEKEASWGKGFMTCSGRQVQVTKRGLDRARSLMRACDEVSREEAQRSVKDFWEIPEPSKAVGKGRGFCRDPKEGPKRVPATGKKLSPQSGSPGPVRWEALGSSGRPKAKEDVAGEAFGDCNRVRGDSFDNGVKKQDEHQEKSVFGFSTALGRKVNVSRESLEKANMFWRESKVSATGLGGGEARAKGWGAPGGSGAVAAGGRGVDGGENGPESGSGELPWEKDLLRFLEEPEESEWSRVCGGDDGASRAGVGRGAGLEGQKRVEVELRGREGCREVEVGVEGRAGGAKRASDVGWERGGAVKRVRSVEGTDAGGEVTRERARRRGKQQEEVEGKGSVKPCEGLHLRRKLSEKQTSWMKAVEGCPPEVHSHDELKRFGVLEDVLSVTADNAGSFSFKGEAFFGKDCWKNVEGVSAGDGCVLILNDENGVGVEECKRAFLASAGVQPNLVPNGWVENHYKMIVWKLAHYERSFPGHFAGNCLTPDNVMFQLKYRYDREIDRCERSALKKILERDNSSSKRLILCVCGIRKIEGSGATEYEIQLTDGWYSCPARFDPAMTRIVDEGKLQVGTKLLIQGAMLVNCDQGVSPLEIGAGVYLKISTNSTRRVRWDMKLGFLKTPDNFPVSLNSILSQGGLVGRIDVIIVRKYPVLYREKLPRGDYVTRNGWSENKVQTEYQKLLEERIETLREEILQEMKKSEMYSKKLAMMDDMDELNEQFAGARGRSDPSAFREQTVEDMRKTQENFRKELNERLRKRLEDENLGRRNVTELFRIKVVDAKRPDYSNPAVLTVWRPHEEVVYLLKEGDVFSIFNLTPSNSSRPLLLNTTNSTSYIQLSRIEDCGARRVTPLKDVGCSGAVFDEVDLVGVVVFTRNVREGSGFTQVFYLTDAELNFVAVVFRGNVRDYGWENTLRLKSIVACSNLELKRSATVLPFASTYVSENTVITENPKQRHLKEGMEKFKESLPEITDSFLSESIEKLITISQEAKELKHSGKNATATQAQSEVPRGRQVSGFRSNPTATSTPFKLFSTKGDADGQKPSTSKPP